MSSDISVWTTSSVFPCFSRPWYFERVQIFDFISSFSAWVHLLLLMTRPRSCFLDRKSCKWCCSLRSPSKEEAHHSNISISGDLNRGHLIILVLVNFLQIKFSILCFTSGLLIYDKEVSWDYANILCLIKSPPISCSIFWRLPSESTPAVIFLKRWFSNYIIPFTFIYWHSQ